MMRVLVPVSGGKGRLRACVVDCLVEKNAGGVL
jgi:hypothetical protein